jgi:Zn-dependent protease with chaperone function
MIGYKVAALLIHEIGHIVSRHSSKSMIKQNFVTLMWAVAMCEDKYDKKESFDEVVDELLFKYAVYLATMSCSSTIQMARAGK